MSSKKKSRVAGVERVKGRYLLQMTVSTVSAGSLVIDPAMFPRTNTISSVYENYRFTSIRLRLLPQVVTALTGTQDQWVLGFNSDVSATLSITNTQQVSECVPSAVQGVSVTNCAAWYPTSEMMLGPKQLIRDTALKWFKVVGDSDTNAWENFQGELLVYNPFAATVTFQMWAEYECEFSSPISSVITRGVPSTGMVLPALPVQKEDVKSAAGSVNRMRGGRLV